MSRLAGSEAGRWATALCTAFALGAGAACSGIVTLHAALVAALTAASLLCSAALFAPLRRAALVALVIAVALVGTLRGAAASGAAGPSQVSGHLGTGAVVVQGTVRDAAHSGDVIVDASRVTDSDGETAVTGGVLVRASNLPAVLPGDRVEVDAAALREPGKRPGPASAAALEREGVQALAASAQMTVVARGTWSPARAAAWVQSRLIGAVNQAIPEPDAALLLGIAFGIRQPLAADVRTPLQDAGLIHIVVVSGLKVVIVIGLIAAVSRRREWSRSRTVLATAPVVAGYVLLSGSGPAAVRSAVMAGAGMLAATGGRRTDPLPMLALAAAGMLALQPALVKDVGFQLSFLGTLGIILMASPLAARIPGPRILVEPFVVTIAAQLATVPVMAGTFGVLSVSGPVANALVLPLLPILIVVGGGAAALAAVAAPLAWAPLHLAAVGVDGIVVLARMVTSVPGAAVHIAMWPLSWTIAELAGIAIAGGAWLCLRRWPALQVRHRWTCAAAAASTAATAAIALASTGGDGRMHVTLLDTGSAPAVLIRTAEGGTALVDAGSNPALLVQALGRTLPPTTGRIDIVVITGGEQAAVAGLAGLSGHYRVGALIDPVALTGGAASLLATMQESGTQIVAGGSSWRWGGAEWRCLRFRADQSGRDMCALQVGDQSGRVLVLGDAGTADQDQLSSIYGASLRADLVITEPGGALSPLLLRAARPKAIAVPVASGATHGPLLTAPPTSRTGVDGDLAYAGGDSGLEEDS